MPLKTKNNKIKETGHIHSFFEGVAKIQGLPNVFIHEILENKSGEPVAIVIGFDEEYVDALFFKNELNLSDPVFRSFKKFSIKVNEKIIGRILDGLGNPLDDLGIIDGENVDVFKNAPTIIEREPVSSPISTGIKIIDTSLPIGKGQRELIIGDRKLGKSTIAIDIVLNQSDADPAIYCIYVICGQKKQKLEDLISVLDKNGAFVYTTVIAATSSMALTNQYLAPFVGCAIGEYFIDKGRHALIVYDDLSKHAKVYRDISLLLQRPPGREAYPGDVFSLHAELLERTAQLSKEKGGGSLTALPIVETQEGNITSFIPTNLISITDGQIYLENGLFQKGFLPAVNVGLSVSRVGSQAQPKTLKKVVGGIRLTLSQHKELQKLSQLETTVSIEAKKKIKRGDLILELLKQDKHANIKWPEQVVLFYSVQKGLFDDVDIDKWTEFEKLFLEMIRSEHIKVLNKIKKGIFNKNIEEKIQYIVNEFKQEFLNPDNIS